MFGRKFENLLKMNTEFGGAEPPTEPVISEDDANPATDPEGQIDQDDAGGGAEPPEPDLTEHVTRRINKVRQEAEEKIRQAEERARQAELRAVRGNDSLEFLQVQGSVNPYTGHVIDNVAEYLSYKKTFDKESQKSDEPENILGLVEQRVSEMMEERERKSNAVQSLQTDMARITRINPNLKTANDIGSLPEADVILEKVSRGYSIYDAYITSVKPKQPKPNGATTEHMVPLGGTAGVSGEQTIPSHELSSWQEDFPNDTMEQLTARYNRALKA